MFSIYIHRDPRTYTVKYVGFTGDIYQRFPQHLACRDQNFKKNVWLKELSRLGMMPVQEVIDLAPTKQEAQRKEAYWLAHFDRSHLTNMSFPPSTLPTPSRETPALLEVEIPAERFAHVMKQDILTDIAFRHGQSIEKVYLSHGQDRVIIVCELIFPWQVGGFLLLRGRSLLQCRVITAYRYKLHGASWATFGAPSRAFEQGSHYAWDFMHGYDFLTMGVDRAMAIADVHGWTPSPGRAAPECRA